MAPLSNLLQTKMERRLVSKRLTLNSWYFLAINLASTTTSTYTPRPYTSLHNPDKSSIPRPYIPKPNRARPAASIRHDPSSSQGHSACGSAKALERPCGTRHVQLHMVSWSLTQETGPPWLVVKSQGMPQEICWRVVFKPKLYGSESPIHAVSTALHQISWSAAQCILQPWENKTL